MSAPEDPRLALRTEIVDRERQYEIKTILEENGFAITDFTIDSTINKLVHKQTHDFFAFQRAHLAQDKPSPISFSVPGSARTAGDTPITFEALKSSFHRWCVHLRQYCKKIEHYRALPDLFTTMRQLPETLELVVRVSRVGDTGISPAQHELIPAQIEQLKQYIIAQGKVTNENMAQLQSGMDYLLEASDRVGRKDWLNLLMATLVTFILSSLFDPARGEELIQYAFGLFQFLFDRHLLGN